MAAHITFSNPIEEAVFFKNKIDALKKSKLLRKGYNQAVCKRYNIKPPYLSKVLSLLTLDEEVQVMIENKLLTKQHGLKLLLVTKDKQHEMAKKAYREAMNATELEKKLKSNILAVPIISDNFDFDTDTKNYFEKVSESLGIQIINNHANHAYSICIKIWDNTLLKTLLILPSLWVENSYFKAVKTTEHDLKDPSFLTVYPQDPLDRNTSISIVVSLFESYYKFIKMKEKRT